MRSILDKQHSPLPISTETSMSSTDNWRTRSQFSEQMTSVQITLPDRFTWLRILGMIIGLITFFSCIFLTLETLVSETTQKDSHRPSLSIFPSYSNALSSPFSNTGVNQSTSKEAYVLFLPSIDRPEYIQSIRILIYGYKYDAETRDETRDVVVMTTPQVPACIEDQLRNEGAIIIRNNLITSIPNPHSTSNSQHPWKDQYNKLLIWNLTQYDQVLYTDADMLMSRSMKEIWNDPGVRYSKESGIGLAARFMRFSGQSDDYLNAGFLVVTPNRTMFEAILEVRGFENGMRDMEQGLINKYFRKDGPHPWVTLIGKWVKPAPSKEDLHGGVHMLHEKCWQDQWDRELTNLWRMKLGKMQGYWAAKREISRRKGEGDV